MHGENAGHQSSLMICSMVEPTVLAKNNKDKGASIHVFLPYEKI